MSVRESLNKLLESLPEDQLREVHDFAAFVNWRQESESWRQFGRAQLARAYGRDEPEYSIMDVKPERNA